jgi:hypothetical protein
VKEYHEMTEQNFLQLEAMDAKAKAEEQRRVWGLFGDADPVVHTFDLFRSHYPQAAHFHGEHRMDDRSFMNGVVPVIRWNRRPAGGARTADCLHRRLDAARQLRQAKSSLVKAFQMLIETYQVYIVMPAPTNDHAALDANARWIEQYLSTPAHDQRDLHQPQAAALWRLLCRHAARRRLHGHHHRLGSDEFKTWEEVITFFERLSPA